MTTPTILGRNNPHRSEVLSLVRRRVASGRFTKTDVDRWKKALEADVVDGIIDELAPKKAKKKTDSKDETAAPEKE